MKSGIKSKDWSPALGRVAAFFLVLSCTFLAPEAARGDDSYTLEALRFTPPEYHVGEQVELCITVDVPESVPVTVPTVMPELGWINFQDIVIVRKGDITDIRILFSSFQTGLKTIPPIDFGGMVLEPLKIHTLSVLDIDPPSFREPAKPMLPPGTVFILVCIIALAMVVPILVISLGHAVKKFFLELLSGGRRKRPVERLRNVLEELRHYNGEGDGDPFYSTLIREFRVFLTERTGEDFLSPTTGEFYRYFSNLIPDQVLAADVTAVFSKGDRTKFGGREVTGGEYVAVVDTIARASDRVEDLMQKRAEPGEDAR